MRNGGASRIRRVAKWCLPGWFALVLTAAWVLHARQLLMSPGGFRNLSSVEFWGPLMFAAIAILLLLQPARSRPRRGHCAKCGYNLTGNEIGVCPECGTPATNREDTA